MEVEKVIFVGIDAGKYGSVAAIPIEGGTLFGIWDMPLDKDGQLDFRAMGNIFDEILKLDYCAHVLIEEIKPVPSKIKGKPFGRGGVASLKLGISYGAWMREIASRGITPECITPAKWKGMVLGGLPKGKLSSVQHASRLFPKQAHLFRGPKGGLMDDRAEATLLAELGRKLWVMSHGR